ncbi:GNAT family N-acetyltransferase [Halomicrobium katesii]|uniref:GNAT family N-acetyltransferase n=1 Tax=Halomicrobium katesii TaxID=437163 RepID=UPI00036561AD|nr:GNAT family N-acetyltransferase [Halomicrobium katesii]
MNGTVRQAREDDDEAVAAFTADTWDDREQRDYIPDVFRDWVAGDGPDQRTVVADVDGRAVGLCQALVLTDHGAWLQGMRVDPDHRRAGLGLRMVDALFEWARDRGATVARNMVFSWNDAGLGQSIAAGFEPVTSFRWAEPTPREGTPGETVDADPAAAWDYWTDSDARTALRGLALDAGHSWALSELSRDGLHDLADEQRVFAVRRDGTCGMACRVRTAAGADERIAEYGVAAWDDADAADALVTAIRDDAAAIGADAVRILLPETPRHVGQAAFVRADTDDSPTFVTAADLTGGE